MTSSELNLRAEHILTGPPDAFQRPLFQWLFLTTGLALALQLHCSAFGDLATLSIRANVLVVKAACRGLPALTQELEKTVFLFSSDI